MAYILDACAIIAYLRNEPGGENVAALVAEDPPECYVHAINLCEVFYDFIRAAGEATADDAVNRLRSVGLIVREDMDEAFWKQVGRYKVSCRVSLADAFVLALAERFHAVVVTSDRKEFEPVAQKALCRVLFLR